MRASDGSARCSAVNCRYLPTAAKHRRSYTGRRKIVALEQQGKVAHLRKRIRGVVDDIELRLVALPLTEAFESIETASTIGSSNGTTAIPARSINSCRMGIELPPLRETNMISVSSSVMAEIKHMGVEMIARR